MVSQDKKLTILQRIREHSEPIALGALLYLLGNGYPERSVRRWVADLVKAGTVEKRGRGRGTRYRVRDQDPEAGSYFSFASQRVVEEVRRPLYERNPTAYREDWFRQYRPNQTFYLPKALREELHGAGRRSSKAEPAGTYARRVYQRLLIDLSFNSSRLEGNTYSLLETEKLVISGEAAVGKLDEERVMILNHKEAIRYLIENASELAVTRETVCTIHYLLSDGLVDAHHAGKVRDHGVRISGSTYIPFDNPQKIDGQLQTACEQANLIDDPFEQSLFLLIHCSYLQAFADVNKRTARLASTIPFMRGNFVPLSFGEVTRDDYSSAMISIYELQDVRPIVDLFSFSYLRTCAAYNATAESMGFDEIRVRYREQRRLVIRSVILKKLHGQPMKSFIQSEAEKLVHEEDLSDFIEDSLEDLQEMDQSRLPGLGITPEELSEWGQGRP